MKRTSPQRYARACILRAGAVLGLVAFILGTGWSAAGQKGGRTVRLANVSELPSSAKRFALVIGVDAYEDRQITPLGGAGNDAVALAAALVEHAGFPSDQVFLLSSSAGDRPTRGNILRRLSNLRGVVPKDGLLLVAFSGHGIERGGKGFLLPADAQSASDVSLLEDTAVSVDRMRELIRATGVAQVLLLVDACRNDPTAGKGDTDNPMTAAFSRGFNFEIANREVQAFATLYAAEVGQRAYEDLARRRGYFSVAVVEGLAGKAANERGEVTLARLVSWVEESVPRRIALDLGPAKRQRPFATIEGYRASELILSRAKAPATTMATVDPKAGEFALWNAIESSRNTADFEDYLERYPGGTYEGAARAKIRQLRAAAAPVEPAPVRPSSAGGGTAQPATRPAVQGGARSFDIGNGASVEMVLVEAGTFMMGSTNGNSDEQPIHRVTISRPYYIGKYEVTQEQWTAVMGTNPSSFMGASLPVEQVSWDDVQEFLRALNAKTGGGWRLPSEAEWEYACRAGTTSDYAGSLDDMAWYATNSGSTTHPVGQKRPNGWGLFDMQGNVWEWCQDWYGSYTPDDRTDPTGAVRGSKRVFRGGSWYSFAADCRSAYRSAFESGSLRSYLGLRLARSS